MKLIDFWKYFDVSFISGLKFLVVFKLAAFKTEKSLKLLLSKKLLKILSKVLYILHYDVRVTVNIY